MTITILLLLSSAIVIYFACELFVNGVEWVGQRANLSRTATGSVLAAFGTALPESVVTFVAVVFGTSAAEKDIGVGAAFGGPLVLATIAYSVVGITMMATTRRGIRAQRSVHADCRRLARDQAWFLIIFAAKLGLGLVAFAGKGWFALAFLAAYAVYVRRELADAAEDEAHPEPLKIRPGDERPAIGWAALQTLVALAVIFGASRLFVAQLGAIGPWLGLPPQLTALLFSPIATELPETMNAIIWVRQGKERMALANISGAMMIQATVPAALGLGFTPWLPEQPLVIGGLITILAVAGLFAVFRRGHASGLGLSWGYLWYLLFAGILVLA